MAIEFKTVVNINGEHLNAIERGNIRASIWSHGKTLTTYGHLCVGDLEQILSKMKELQSEVVESESVDHKKNKKCPWCCKKIHYGEQPVVYRDDDYMHLSCAAEEDDEVMFDRDMGFGG